MTHSLLSNWPLVLAWAGACLAAGSAFAQTPARPASATSAPSAATFKGAPVVSPLQQGNSPLGCLIGASATIDVGSSIIGVLDSIMVERGGLVKKGQVLARFESAVEQAAVALAQTRVSNQADILSARSQQAFTAQKAKRTAELTEQKFLSDQARELADTEASMADMKLQQAMEQRAVAVNELRVAQAQLAQRTITSPIEGVVIDRLASVGERIENRPIMKLAQIDPLRVEVVMPASRFKSIRAGMSANVLPALPDTPAQRATVTIVDRVIDASSNTFRARLELPNHDHSLPSGVRCTVEFGP